MICEMCGAGKLHLYKAIVEGSMLSVCEKCKQHGEVISIEKPRTEKPKKQKTPEPQFVDEKKEEIIVDDYAEKIKEARERKEITQERLAKELAEKESVIQKVESKQMLPSMTLAKKLQQYLKISLIEEFDPSKNPTKSMDLKDETITIGDMIRLKKK